MADTVSFGICGSGGGGYEAGGSLGGQCRKKGDFRKCPEKNGGVCEKLGGEKDTGNVGFAVGYGVFPE